MAQRASVSFQAFAKPEDAPQVFALMGHTDSTVRYNARAWLFREFQGAGTQSLAAAGRRSGLSEDVQRQVGKEFAAFLANPPARFKSPLYPVLKYIPNLRDIA